MEIIILAIKGDQQEGIGISKCLIGLLEDIMLYKSSAHKI